MSTMLNAGLVLEGGGFRGVYTAGVLDCFLDEGLDFAKVFGISAGACNALNYLSRNRGRYIQVAQTYCADPRYVGLRQLLTTGSIFSWQFSFYEIAEKYIPFDDETLRQTPSLLFVGATDCLTGQCTYFCNRDPEVDLLRACIASSSMPLLSVIQHIGGRPYLDGGISDSIPVSKALAAGCPRVVAVLTRPQGYRKSPSRLGMAMALRYRRYPKLVRAMESRHLRYNQSLDLCRELEDQGRGVVICPSRPLGVGRIERDPQKLRQAYQLGLADAQAALPAIRALCGVREGQR